ncbi:putative methyltransferase [Pseudomonas amygdali pv. mori]|uniref:Putative methyltransferase n=1 Tax=Pseudomonas amygdali pv. mori TaxID=34065 RepID=A0A3M5IND2_PSEA0|nr:N-6 DNA methylase [Pseudomonas amygdali]RMT12423.1 putative methyltransferase [Pseudomonas amygdali pv. mori]
MNELKTKIESLKKTIFKISNNPKTSDSNNQDLSFKTFVQIALDSSVESLAQRYAHYGVSKPDLKNHIAIGNVFEPFKCLPDDLQYFDQMSLAIAINQYNTIVRESEPFEDILSLLAEEVLLNKGRGKSKGQFMTPPDIAKFMAKLIYTPIEENKPHKFADPCVGYGALMLAHLWYQYRVNPDEIKNIEVVVNDIDPMMCHVASLQILANTTQHNIDLKNYLMICSNAITQYDVGDTQFLINLLTPEIVKKKQSEINHFKLFSELMNEVISNPRETLGAV